MELNIFKLNIFVCLLAICDSSSGNCMNFSHFPDGLLWLFLSNVIYSLCVCMCVCVSFPLALPSNGDFPRTVFHWQPTTGLSFHFISRTSLQTAHRLLFGAISKCPQSSLFFNFRFLQCMFVAHTTFMTEIWSAHTTQLTSCYVPSPSFPPSLATFPFLKHLSNSGR